MPPVVVHPLLLPDGTSMMAVNEVGAASLPAVTLLWMEIGTRPAPPAAIGYRPRGAGVL